MPRTKWLILAIILFLPLGLTLAEFAFNVDTPHKLSDFMYYWMGGYDLRTGQNPYLANDWAATNATFHALWDLNNHEAFSYPPHLGIFISLLTLLPYSQAHILWLVLSQVMLIIAVFMLLSIWQIKEVNRYILPVLLSLIIFRPVWMVLLIGQLSAVFVLIVAVAIWLWETKLLGFGWVGDRLACT